MVMPLAEASRLTVTDGIEWRRSSAPVPYAAAVTAMEDRVEQILAGRAPEVVWLLEHPSVYTGGVSACAAEVLAVGDVPVVATARGGRYTYHGPGQRVVYLMIDLGRRGRDVRRFVASIEGWAIGALAAFGVTAERRADRVGLWVVNEDGPEAKISAIGLRLRRWISYHGIAINVDPDLGFFDGIVPCGLTGFGVTSLRALGRPVTMDALDAELIRTFEHNFIAKLPSALDAKSVRIG